MKEEKINRLERLAKKRAEVLSRFVRFIGLEVPRFILEDEQRVFRETEKEFRDFASSLGLSNEEQERILKTASRKVALEERAKRFFDEGPFGELSWLLLTYGYEWTLPQEKGEFKKGDLAEEEIEEMSSEILEIHEMPLGEIRGKVMNASTQKEAMMLLRDLVSRSRADLLVAMLALCKGLLERGVPVEKLTDYLGKLFESLVKER